MPGLGKTAWVESIFKIAWPALVRVTDPAWMPRREEILPDSPGALTNPRRKPKFEIEEYGCGHYGCVMPTQAIPGVVVKLTTDPSEAAFVAAALHIGQDEDAGLVRYVGIYQIPGTMHLGRPVYVLWREEAQDVGTVFAPLGARWGRGDYEIESLKTLQRYMDNYQTSAALLRKAFGKKDQFSILAQVPRYREWAWGHVAEIDLDRAVAVRHASSYMHPPDAVSLTHRIQSFRGPQRAALCLRLCEAYAELMENSYLCDAIGREFARYQEHGLLLADVHAGNIGRVERMGSIPVITDPGHAVVLDPRWQSITVPVLPM